MLGIKMNNNVRNCETICQHIDFLLLPEAVAERLDLDAIEREFVRPLGAHRLERIQAAGHTGLVAIVAENKPSTPQDLELSGRHVIQSGFWPDTPGMRLEITSDSWEIQSDFMAISPIYYATNSNQELFVSTRSDLLAALVDSRLYMDAIIEHLRLGFLLDNHTLYEKVYRIRDGEKISVSPTHGKVLPPARSIYGTANINQNWNDEQWLAPVAQKTANYFRQGMSVHLTGGVDSRLVFALGVHGGQPPVQAITGGDPNSEDVEIARAICERYGVEHIVAPFPKDRSEGLLEEAKRSAALRGYASINAATYANFFRNMRQREALRKFPGEVGGLGGECAEGFYYTPLDKLCIGKQGLEQWLKMRIVKLAPRSAALFESNSWQAAEAALLERLQGLFAEVPGDLRRKSDAFYVRQRMRHWVGAVLHAAGSCYWAAQPLFAKEHILWAETLPSSARYGRKRQMQTIYDIDPWLGDLKFNDGRRRRRPLGSGAIHMLTTTKKLANKATNILRKKSVNREQLAQTSIQHLMALASVRESLNHLATELPIEVDERVLTSFQQSPSAYEQELGMLLSIAWGWESVNRYKSLLSNVRRPVS